MTEFVLLLLPLASASTPSERGAESRPAEVETIDGIVRGVLEGLEGGGRSPRLRLAGRSIPLERVIRVRLAPELAVRRETTVVLAGGDALHGGITGGDADALAFSSFALEATRIPLDGIRAVLFRARLPDEAAAATLRDRILREPPASDVLYGVDGGRIEGILESIDGLRVRIRSSGAGELEIALTKIQAIAVAPVDRPAAPERSGRATTVLFRDGSALTGRLSTLTEGVLRIEHPVLGAIAIPLRRVHAVEFRGGLCTYLSDLEPAAVEERTYFGPQLWPHRRDANVLGGPLAIRGKRFRRGLGVHAYSKLTYRLDGGYARFEAVIGLDDAARGDARDPLLGNVVFRVHVDGEKRFDSGIVTWKDDPRPVRVDVRGAKALVLEVDFGEGFHARDRADWADARLIRLPAGEAPR